MFKKEVTSAIILSELLQGNTFLPITNSSINNVSLRLMLNDVVINSRKRIVEFGAGVSTIVFARLFKKNGIKGKIFSIDEDKEWIKILENILERESLNGYVKFIYAPLNKNKKVRSLKHLKWYDENILNENLEENKFDLAFVDGPCAYRKGIEFSRYPSLPFIKNKMNSNFSFFLDDVNRNGESKILKLWEKEFKLKFKVINKNLGFAYKGNIFNINF